MIHRLILWLSLIGMILVLHLWVQKARGFDQGCLGLNKPVFVQQGGCSEVSDLPASHLFGLSNAVWGYAFYFGLALISFAKILARPVWARRLHGLSEVGVLLALLYSGYLVYQMGFVAQAWCVLCVTSAALIVGLFILHVRLRWQGGFTPIPEAARGTELGLAVGGLFAASGLLVGVLLFVNRLGTRPLDQGSSARELEDAVGSALVTFIDADRLREMQACHFDGSAPELDLKGIVGTDTPFIGNPTGVPVVVFYDPNCGHCRNYHAVFLKLAERFKDRARFTVIPRVLWDRSLPAAEALLLAERSGNYFELWQRLFDRHSDEASELTSSEIATWFRELGIDTANLDQRLAAAHPMAVARRKQLTAVGVDSLPAIYIGGKRVWGPNQSEVCVAKLIEATLAEVHDRKRR